MPTVLTAWATLRNVVLMAFLLLSSVQELDGFARHAHLGDIIAQCGLDFEPPVAGGDFELPGGAEKAVAQDSCREDILGGRGRGELDTLGPYQHRERAAGGP